jgi:hypothetical protein
MTLGSRLLRSRQHSKTTSRKQRDPFNCHYLALRGTHLNKYSVNSFSIKYHVSHDTNHYQLIHSSIFHTVDSDMSIAMIRLGGAHSTRINHQKLNNQRELDADSQSECRWHDILSSLAKGSWCWRHYQKGGNSTLINFFNQCFQL